MSLSSHSTGFLPLFATNQSGINSLRKSRYTSQLIVVFSAPSFQKLILIKYIAIISIHSLCFISPDGKDGDSSLGSNQTNFGSGQVFDTIPAMFLQWQECGEAVQDDLQFDEYCCYICLIGMLFVHLLENEKCNFPFFAQT